jgi:formylglycine-generating enzyme required for sulfatase activity
VSPVRQADAFAPTEAAAEVRRIIPAVPRDAFISHASVDAGLALAICQGLETRGLTCWIAPRDVRSEGTYGTEIIRGLRECATFLIVLTAASSESQQVEREAERASHYQKRIIPLSVGGGEPGERLEFYTAGRQRVACATTIDDAFLDRLAAVIRGDQPAVAEVEPAHPASRRFPRAAYAALGGLVAIAVVAVWLSGVLTRPSGPPASQPQNTPVSPPANQPGAQPPQQPETTPTGDTQVPPGGKGPEQKPRGATAPPSSEKAKSASSIAPAPPVAPRADPPARSAEPPSLVVDGRTLRFVAIPQGTFTMGCTPGDEDCTEDEKVHKELTVRAFQMSATEVTQAFWEATMGGNPSDFNGPQQPVENVTWQEATAFANKLTQRGDGFTYRLPREAEWEYAAKANGPVPAQLSSVAWFGLLATAGSDARPRDVAKKKPNAWGLFDMLGNVAEWCQDWFSPEYQRVIRGGAWTDGPTSVRFSARGKAVPTSRTYSIGVRLVRTPTGS